jgi:broad specificity phosphatase PhoE
MAAVRAMTERYPSGLLCVVTHKVVLTVIRCELTGEPLEPALRRLPANASFERVEVPEEFVRRSTACPELAEGFNVQRLP